MQRLLTIRFATLLAILFAASSAAEPAAGEVDAREVRALVGDWSRFQEIESIGPEVLPVLADLYRDADVAERADIARIFYRLGWPSDDAKRVLMQDVHTRHESLRLEVQWALGRVSGDDDVVATLLRNMRNDENPLFRDKAACALAHDQIHIDDEQRLRLLGGLIDSLEDPKPQVRHIAMLALEIQTGQRKGFQPNAPAEDRARAVDAWRRWLADYEASR